MYSSDVNTEVGPVLGSVLEKICNEDIVQIPLLWLRSMAAL